MHAMRMGLHSFLELLLPDYLAMTLLSGPVPITSNTICVRQQTSVKNSDWHLLAICLNNDKKKCCLLYMLFLIMFEVFASYMPWDINGETRC